MEKKNLCFSDIEFNDVFFSSASKSHMQGSIYLWSWNTTRASWNSKKNEVPAVILAELQWSSTDIPYLSLGTCPGIHVTHHMVKCYQIDKEIILFCGLLVT